MKRIVWLASWYPNDLDPLTGDFIKRHAQACSLYQPVDVIHVKKNDPANHQKNRTTITTDASYPHLRETIIYYNVPALAGAERLFSYIYSLWRYHRAVKKYIQQHGKPHMLHVHVMLRCGLVALYYKWVHKMPYLVTEHYAGYMPEAKGYSKGVTILNYIPLKCIIKNADVVMPVSSALAPALEKKFTLKKTVVVPNVVNTDIFYPVPGDKSSQPVTFLHISTLTPQKNAGQMLAGFALLKKQYGCAFELWVVSPPNVTFKRLASELQIGSEVRWLEETTQYNIALLMRQASALVLYSHFETFGCVNIEAMACGLPVIVSDLPVFREYLRQNITAWFAPSGDPAALAGILRDFIINVNANIDAGVIAHQAKRFDYYTVGKLIANQYEDVVSQQISFF
jgi:glycosyltransferase involved in cell wall biosynthesis